MSMRPHTLADFSPVPMLFICGTADTAVELKNSEKMYDEAKDPKELWKIPDGRHGNLYEINSGQLREQLMSYLSKTSTGKP